MRIAIDVEALGSGKAGIATVVGNLRREFVRQRRSVVFLTYPKSRARKTAFRRLLNAARHLFYILVELPLKLRRERIDVLIGAAFYAPLWMPRRCRSIVIVYDLVPLTNPEGQDRLNALYRNTLGRLCARRADCVVVNSEYVRRQVHRLAGVPWCRIEVERLAAADFWRPAPEDERRKALEKFALCSKDYFLFAGANDPRKNVARLMEAYARCVASDAGFPQLVIAGGGFANERRAATAGLGIASRVTFAGYVTQEELRALYSDALAFVFPSLAEGFGLPVLEAMACGTPVVTSRVTSLPEVAGDAAILLNPTSIVQIANALKAIVLRKDLREELIRRGRRRVRRFSWSRFARKLRDLAAELHGESRTRKETRTAKRAA